MKPGDKLNNIITELAKLELRKRKLEDELSEVNDSIKMYQVSILPDAMDEVGSDLFRTQTGLEVEVKDQVFASFPKNPDKQQKAFQYLEQTQNDGIVKHKITITYGRDSHDMAKQIMEKLQEMGVDRSARVEQAPTIHPGTLKKFLREELERGAEVPLEAFGAFVQRIAKIKL